MQDASRSSRQRRQGNSRPNSTVSEDSVKHSLQIIENWRQDVTQLQVLPGVSSYIIVLLLGWGIAEIPQYIYRLINGRLACPPSARTRTGHIFLWPMHPFFSVFFFFFFCIAHNQVLFVPLLQLIGHLFISIVLEKAAIFHHKLEWIEWTMWSKLCLISVSVYWKNKNKKSGNSCSRRVRECKRSGISEGLWYGGRGFFIGCFSVGSSSLKKI